jgi:hypothetical protein
MAGSLALAAFAGPVAQAMAVEPTRQTVVQLGAHTTAPCPSGVVLQGLFDITREIVTFYDRDGAPASLLSVNRAEGSWTNPMTGASLEAEVGRQVRTDLSTGESFSAGSNSRTFLPGGGGVAIGAAGLQIFDASGKLVAHYGPDSEKERAQLCAALGA